MTTDAMKLTKNDGPIALSGMSLYPSSHRRRCTMPPPRTRIAARHRAGRSAATQPSTTIVPCIDVWMPQMYGNVPGSLNVNENVAPLSRSGDANEPSSDSTVCVSLSPFVQVTTVPGWTVNSAGLKAKSRISTVAEPVGGTVDPPGSVVVTAFPPPSSLDVAAAPMAATDATTVTTAAARTSTRGRSTTSLHSTPHGGARCFSAERAGVSMALPRVLAGPIVRRVEPAGCSFWLALSEQATVTARVWLGEKSAPVPDADAPLAEAQLATRAIGTGLHVVVVTVDTSGTPLRAGERYSYDLQFALAGGATSDLHGEKLLEDEDPAARITNVATGGSTASRARVRQGQAAVVPRPAVDVRADEPPTPAAGLRLAHASCRRPGSGAVDALPGLVELVKSDATRPHQLHLTGDQIYADDIATPFLPLVAAIGVELAGAQSLPGFPPDPRPVVPDRHR